MEGQNKIENPPAFPVPSVGTGDPRDGMTTGSDGMTLRDYFAAKAMPVLLGAMMADPKDRSQSNPLTVMQIAAEASYRMADALLKARLQ